MAVPKKRTGHSAQGKRRSNWKATNPEVTKCSHCGAPVLAHTVCGACGYYKGKAVSIKSPDYVAEGAEAKEVKSEKKPAVKKTTAAKPKTSAKKATATKAEVSEKAEKPAKETKKAKKPEEKPEEK